MSNLIDKRDVEFFLDQANKKHREEMEEKISESNMRLNNAYRNWIFRNYPNCMFKEFFVPVTYSIKCEFCPNPVTFLVYSVEEVAQIKKRLIIECSDCVTIPF